MLYTKWKKSICKSTGVKWLLPLKRKCKWLCQSDDSHCIEDFEFVLFCFAKVIQCDYAVFMIWKIFSSDEWEEKLKSLSGVDFSDVHEISF